MSHGHSKYVDGFREAHARGIFAGHGSRSETIAKGKNNWKKFFYTWSNLATPAIYNRAYTKKPVNISPANPKDVTKPILLLLFLKKYEKCLEMLTSLKEAYVLTTFGK